MYEMGRDIPTRVLRSENGCKIRVTHVLTRSDCVHTRDDTDGLNYASRFVHHLQLTYCLNQARYRDTLRRCGLAVPER